MDRDTLLKLADTYKEQIFSKLSELAPRRITQIDRHELEGKTTEEVLSLLYLQGVAEALDAFDLAELLHAAGDKDPYLTA